VNDEDVVLPEKTGRLTSPSTLVTKYLDTIKVRGNIIARKKVNDEDVVLPERVNDGDIVLPEKEKK